MTCSKIFSKRGFCVCALHLVSVWSHIIWHCIKDGNRSDGEWSLPNFSESVFILLIFCKGILQTFLNMQYYISTKFDAFYSMQCKHLFSNVSNNVILIKSLFMLISELVFSREMSVLSPSPFKYSTGVPAAASSFTPFSPLMHSINRAQSEWFFTQRCSLVFWPGRFLFHQLHVPQFLWVITVLITLFPYFEAHKERLRWKKRKQNSVWKIYVHNKLFITWLIRTPFGIYVVKKWIPQKCI